MNPPKSPIFKPNLEINKRVQVPTSKTKKDSVEFETVSYPPLAPSDGLGMHSLKKLYRVGLGPSSSHTMGPNRASIRFLKKNPNAFKFKVELYGSLAATGVGHMTDKAIFDVLSKEKTKLIFKPHEYLPFHPNGMKFFAYTEDDTILDEYVVYSVGGGALVDEMENINALPGSVEGAKWNKYKLHTMNQLLEYCNKTGSPLHQYVYDCEGEEIKDHLRTVWKAMEDCLKRGIASTGILPGGLGVPRKARMIHRKTMTKEGGSKRIGLVFCYALAAMEENASGHTVVTAPTCGASGVLPATLGYMKESLNLNEDEIVDALATAGIVGNIVKHNASISGAEVGCQGEVGTATAMAAAACAFLMGGTPAQIETAAEMGMEHFLGLTCDPVEGLVQIPCIERNAFGATRALDAAEFALMLDGRHTISFDEVVLTMKLTGLDIEECYRETSRGGLSKTWNLDEKLAESKGDMNELIQELIDQKKTKRLSGFKSTTPIKIEIENEEEATELIHDLVDQRSRLSTVDKASPITIHIEDENHRQWAEIVENCKQPRMPVYC